MKILKRTFVSPVMFLTLLTADFILVARYIKKGTTARIVPGDYRLLNLTGFLAAWAEE